MLKDEAACAGWPGTDELVYRGRHGTALFRRIVLHVRIHVLLMLSGRSLARKNVVDTCPNLGDHRGETMAMKRVPCVSDGNTVFRQNLLEGRLGSLFKIGSLSLLACQDVSLGLGYLEPTRLHFEKDLPAGQRA